jgi:hypothetical protein
MKGVLSDTKDIDMAKANTGTLMLIALSPCGHAHMSSSVESLEVNHV